MKLDGLVILSNIISSQKKKKKMTRGFSGGSGEKNWLPIQETQVRSLVWEDAT